MTINRHTRDSILDAGKAYGTALSVNAIRLAIRRGVIDLDTKILSEDERLDVIAGQVYGDASMWWLIAAASNIGWGLQVPAGTILKIPTDLNQIGDLVA